MMHKSMQVSRHEEAAKCGHRALGQTASEVLSCVAHQRVPLPPSDHSSPPCTEAASECCCTVNQITRTVPFIIHCPGI